MTKEFQFPSREDIITAHQRIVDYIHQTPVLSSQLINEILGCEIHFKCENLQKAGAFKSRGASNAVFSLSSEQTTKGVCTHSSGNHAQALARVAQQTGIAAYIIMPSNAPRVKIAAVENYGGKISFCEPTLQAREEKLAEIMEITGATFVHPYNNLQVITGQATAAKELIEKVAGLDYVIAPVGGGGLLSGTALSCSYFAPKTKVIGAEPAMADDAYQSFTKKRFIPSENPKTMADGLLTSLGEYTFPIVSKHVDHIMLCEEKTIVEAMKLVYERMKIVIEPSSAVALAIIMENKAFFKNKKIGLIISGGNVDLGDFLQSFLDK